MLFSYDSSRFRRNALERSSRFVNEFLAQSLLVEVAKARESNDLSNSGGIGVFRAHCILGQAFNTHIIPPPFLMCLPTKSIFLDYSNDSTLTLLRNSLFNISKRNILSLLQKAPKGGVNEESLSDYTVLNGVVVTQLCLQR